MAINNARVVKAIRESMTNNFILSLTYKRERDNRQITRMVEPYEIKEMEAQIEKEKQAYGREPEDDI